MPKVRVMNPEEVSKDCLKRIGWMASVSTNFDKEEHYERVAKKCIEDGHKVPTYGFLFLLEISEVSRTLSHELVRQEQGFYKVQRSQRYTISKPFGDIIPPIPEPCGERVHSRKYYVNQENFLADMYEQGYSLGELGNIYKINEGTLFKILKRYVDIRDLSSSKGINKQYFSEFDNPTKSHILGLIFTDGNIGTHKKGGYFSISQHADEYILLHNICNEIKLKGKVHKAGRDNAINIMIQDDCIYNDLVSLGLIERKTTKTDCSKLFSLLSDDNKRHFIRGVFEGDGHLSIKTKNDCIRDARMSIAGSESMLSTIKDYFIEKGLCSSSKVITKNGNGHSVIFGGKPQVTKIIEWMYKGFNPKFFHSKKMKMACKLSPQILKDFRLVMIRYLNDEFEVTMPRTLLSFTAIWEFYQSIFNSAQSNKRLIYELACSGTYGRDAIQDTRYILPNATHTKLHVAVNLEALMRFGNMRCCSLAQPEMQELAWEIKYAIAEVNPYLGSLIVPMCDKLGYCIDSRCCGKAETKKRIEELIEKGRMYEQLI